MGGRGWQFFQKVLAAQDLHTRPETTMSHLGGKQLIERIRSDERTATLPLLVLTAASDVAMEEMAVSDQVNTGDVRAYREDLRKASTRKLIKARDAARRVKAAAKAEAANKKTIRAAADDSNEEITCLRKKKYTCQFLKTY